MSRFSAVIWTAFGGALSLLLTGCQVTTSPTVLPSPPTASPTPTPAPSPTCTPEAGGAEFPCTPAQYDAMKAKDALYAEAEGVFRKMFAENIRISRAGGVREPTAVLLETTTGTYLDDAMKIYRNMTERHLRARGDDPTIIVKRMPNTSKGGSIVALSVCVDASNWGFYVGEKLSTKGFPAVDQVYFSRFGGTLKLIGADGRKVPSCA